MASSSQLPPSQELDVLWNNPFKPASRSAQNGASVSPRIPRVKSPGPLQHSLPSMLNESNTLSD